MNPHVADLSGQRFGRLLVLKRAGRNDRGDALWECRCDCGRDRIVMGYHLRAGKSRSCGCGRRKSGDASSRHSLFLQYSVKARRLGMTFELTPGECFALFRGDCVYCGVVPAQVFRRKNHYKGKIAEWHPEPYIYNGIDRLDSSHGYLRTNVVSCCGPCNRAKMAMTYDEFMEWIERVHAHAHSRPLRTDLRSLVTVPDLAG